MARGINKVILIAGLGADPEVRATTTGSRVATISAATTESWMDKNTNQRVEKTEWHRVVFFNRLAEIVEQYLKKGSQVYIEGRLQTRKWQDKNGQDRWTTEVVANEMQMLGGGAKADNAGDTATAPAANSASSAAPTAATGADMPDDFADDIPF